MKTISEVSRIVGISRRTLQYYDDEGILLTERTPNNHRVYDQNAMESIWQILVYKEMDFELQEIRQLLKSDKAQKDLYFKKRIEAIRNQIITLKVQMKFISLVQVKEMPAKPDENSGKDICEAHRRTKKKNPGGSYRVTVRSSGKGQADLCLPDAFLLIL